MESFAVAAEAIQRLPWFTADWSCCSGLWKTERYPDAVVLRLTKRNWSSVFPVSLHEGGEIQYAAWIDEKLQRRSTVRVEMHVFSWLTKKKIRKGDFTEAFRTRNEAAIRTFGSHDTERGPAVPYAGEYKYKDLQDLHGFLIWDFSNFASLSDSIDEHLAMVGSGVGE